MSDRESMVRRKLNESVIIDINFFYSSFYRIGIPYLQIYPLFLFFSLFFFLVERYFVTPLDFPLSLLYCTSLYSIQFYSPFFFILFYPLSYSFLFSHLFFFFPTSVGPRRLEQLVAIHRQLLRKFAMLELENGESKKKIQVMV